MSSVNRSDTKPEMELRRLLHANGFRYRLHDKKLPGTPDIVLPRYKTAIFVNGCFWHSHDGCKFATKPSSHKAFWENKLTANIARDRKNHIALQSMGWKVLVVWECAIKKRDPDKSANLLSQAKGFMLSNDSFREIGAEV